MRGPSSHLTCNDPYYIGQIKNSLEKKPAFHLKANKVKLKFKSIKLVKVEPGLFLENFVTETLSFRRSVASLSHIRLRLVRVTQSGGVHDKLPVSRIEFTLKSSVYGPIIGLGTRT